MNPMSASFDDLATEDLMSVSVARAIRPANGQSALVEATLGQRANEAKTPEQRFDHRTDRHYGEIAP